MFAQPSMAAHFLEACNNRLIKQFIQKITDGVIKCDQIYIASDIKVTKSFCFEIGINDGTRKTQTKDYAIKLNLYIDPAENCAQALGMAIPRKQVYSTQA